MRQTENSLMKLEIPWSGSLYGLKLQHSTRETSSPVLTFWNRNRRSFPQFKATWAAEPSQGSMLFANRLFFPGNFERAFAQWQEMEAA